MHNLHSHRKNSERRRQKIKQVRLDQRLRDKRFTFSNQSNERTKAWADNLSAEVCSQIVNGSVRETNTEGHLRFEVGNWHGKKLSTTDRHYDSLYQRYYVPDAVRQLDQARKGGAYFQDHLANNPYDQPGERGTSPNERFKQLLSERLRVKEKHPPFITSKLVSKDSRATLKQKSPSPKKVPEVVIPVSKPSGIENLRVNSQSALQALGVSKKRNKQFGQLRSQSQLTTIRDRDDYIATNPKTIFKAPHNNQWSVSIGINRSNNSGSTWDQPPIGEANPYIEGSQALGTHCMSRQRRHIKELHRVKEREALAKKIDALRREAFPEEQQRPPIEPVDEASADKRFFVSTSKLTDRMKEEEASKSIRKKEAEDFENNLSSHQHTAASLKFAKQGSWGHSDVSFTQSFLNLKASKQNTAGANAILKPSTNVNIKDFLRQSKVGDSQNPFTNRSDLNMRMEASTTAPDDTQKNGVSTTRRDYTELFNSKMNTDRQDPSTIKIVNQSILTSEPNLGTQVQITARMLNEESSQKLINSSLQQIKVPTFNQSAASSDRGVIFSSPRSKKEKTYFKSMEHSHAFASQAQQKREKVEQLVKNIDHSFVNLDQVRDQLKSFSSANPHKVSKPSTSTRPQSKPADSSLNIKLDLVQEEKRMGFKNRINQDTSCDEEDPPEQLDAYFQKMTMNSSFSTTKKVGAPMTAQEFRKRHIQSKHQTNRPEKRVKTREGGRLQGLTESARFEPPSPNKDFSRPADYVVGSSSLTKTSDRPRPSTRVLNHPSPQNRFLPKNGEHMRSYGYKTGFTGGSNYLTGTSQPLARMLNQRSQTTLFKDERRQSAQIDERSRSVSQKVVRKANPSSAMSSPRETTDYQSKEKYPSRVRHRKMRPGNMTKGEFISFAISKIF